MQTSENLGLKLPEQTDNIDVDVISENFRTLDKSIISDTVRRMEIMTETAFGELTPAGNTVYLVQDDTTGLLKSVYYGAVLLWERSM